MARWDTNSQMGQGTIRGFARSAAELAWASLALALSTLLALPAHSEEAASIAQQRQGGFIGVSGSVAFDDFAGFPGVEIGKPFGFSVFGGLRGNRWVAVEVQFQWLDDFDFESAAGSGRVESWIVTANSKLYPIEGRLEPYALVGLGGGRARTRIADLQATDSGFLFRFGAGLDLHLTRRWSLALMGSYVLGVGELDGFDLATIDWGVQFHF